MIPQISLIMGPCAGGAVYSPAMTDFIFMVKETSHMFITGPEVIKTVTGEEVEFEELGGAMSHNSKSGVAHFAADDEEQCLEDARYLMSFLPSNNLELPPRVEPTDDPDREDPELDSIVPDDPQKPYDMRDVISRIVDDGEFFEVHEHFAKNIVCGFSRLDGHPAWPTAEVAVMGPRGAVNIIYRKDISSSPTPDERRAKLIDDYKAHFANPYSAAERGYIDDVIEPHQTRPKLIRALRTLQTKRVDQPKRKAGNIPL